MPKKKPCEIIGSAAWLVGESRYAVRGVVDTILRLFETGSITRSKCRELIHVVGETWLWQEPPKAPWEELDWEPGEECPTCRRERSKHHA